MTGLRPGHPLFVCQVKRHGQTGPVAPWITMANWAKAAADRYEDSSLVTREGVLTPGDALARAATRTEPSEHRPGRTRSVPEPVVTLGKDLRRIAENRSFSRQCEQHVQSIVDVPYVFQLHGLFWDAGLRLAKIRHCPSVLVVDACQVQEARTWGVHRKGYGTLAERFGEWPQLRHADLVACVSEEVAEQVARATGRRAGVLVVPNGIDPELFAPGPADMALRARLGLGDAFVIGWVGSFRSFHGLDVLLDAAARAQGHMPELALLLVGDGQGRAAIESRAKALGVRAVFPGTVPFAEVPKHLHLMDVAVALAPTSEFHYSPVKVREYQACGRPVVAAAAGELARNFTSTAHLVPPGDPAALADGLVAIHDDPASAMAMAERARGEVIATSTWSARLDVIERALGAPSG